MVQSKEARKAYKQRCGMSKWISVKNKLPGMNERVLVFCDGIISIATAHLIIGSDRGMAFSKYMEFREGDIEFYDLTHWMPLPKKPRVKQTSKEHATNREYYSEWYSKNRVRLCLNRRRRWEVSQAKLGKIAKPYKPRIEISRTWENYECEVEADESFSKEEILEYALLSDKKNLLTTDEVFEGVYAREVKVKHE